MLSFIERFGARPAKIEHRLEVVRGMKRDADHLYLQQKYSEALDRLDDVAKELDDLQVQAAKARRTALFWVYLTEWMSIFATCLLVGAVVWSLMVRKKLYREAGVTTLRREA